MILIIGMALSVAALVGGWAWRWQLATLHAVGLRMAQLAGTPGTLVDVELTAVLARGASVLVAFRPAGMKVRPGLTPSARPAPTTLVLALDEEHDLVLGRLKRWEASAAPLLLWRDLSGDTVELSQVHTGQRLCLPVLAAKVPDSPSPVLR
jgi:hypothetical protein